MRKILVALMVACLLSATTVAPVLANGWGGHGGCGFNSLWPIVREYMSHRLNPTPHHTMLRGKVGECIFFSLRG